jgi:hypothetical protein
MVIGEREGRWLIYMQQQEVMPSARTEIATSVVSFKNISAMLGTRDVLAIKKTGETSRNDR